MKSNGEPSGLEQVVKSYALFDKFIADDKNTDLDWDTMTTPDIVCIVLATFGRLEQCRYELKAKSASAFDSESLLGRFSTLDIYALRTKCSETVDRASERYLSEKRRRDFHGSSPTLD